MEEQFKVVLVTGGAGFLGSHLCKELIARGDHVICVDNLQTGSLSNIQELLPLPNFEFYQFDIIEKRQMVGIDEIYHLACPASPPAYQADPIHTMKTNVIGSINMLEVARENNAKILLTSTSEVYGDPEQHPQTEEYKGNVNTIGPRACYDEGKRAAETLFFDYMRTYGVEIKVARIFNTYGPGMDPLDGRVVSNFINQALRGEALTLYGNGHQTRSFCYVSDTINGLIKLMDKDGVIGPLNIGNRTEYMMTEIAAKVLLYTNSDYSLIYKDLPEDDPKKRQPDTKLANELLGWEAEVPLCVGLKQTIEYFKNLEGNP